MRSRCMLRCLATAMDLRRRGRTYPERNFFCSLRVLFLCAVIPLLCFSNEAVAQNSCTSNISPLLSSSASNYAAASNDTLVEVTEAEFRNVQANLDSATFIGWDPNTTPDTHGFGGEYTEVINSSEAIIPENKVLVGFYLDVSAAPNSISPRVATYRSSGMDIMLSWPDVTVNSVGGKWFIIKDPTKFISTAGYLGLHRTAAVRGWNSGVSGLYYYGLGVGTRAVQNRTLRSNGS